MTPDERPPLPSAAQVLADQLAELPRDQLVEAVVQILDRARVSAGAESRSCIIRAHVEKILVGRLRPSASVLIIDDSPRDQGVRDEEQAHYARQRAAYERRVEERQGQHGMGAMLRAWLSWLPAPPRPDAPA